MAELKRNHEALKTIIRGFEKEWQTTAAQAVNDLYVMLEGGVKTGQAINHLKDNYPGLFNLNGIDEAMYKAAAYGYGIAPETMSPAQQQRLALELSAPWDASKLTLSQKIHGYGLNVTELITNTVNKQLKAGQTWRNMAQSLYDGYNAGHVVTKQDIPAYLKAVRSAAIEEDSQELLKSSRKALRNIERLAQKGAPTNALKAAYKKLIDEAEKGSAEELEKACMTAIEEKSRYIAQRIVRTEAARAWGEGFFASIANDGDVVGIKWEIGSRHPYVDTCDFLARANLYNLGAGIFPKDKPPRYPAHPHCLCRLSEVYRGEINAAKGKDNIQAGGEAFLNSISGLGREQLLGAAGAGAYDNGVSWQGVLRGWEGFDTPRENILRDAMSKNLFPPTDDLSQN